MDSGIVPPHIAAMQKMLLTILLFITGHCYAQRYAIVIDEIMADPTPSAGLPAYEWIELRNISTQTINLQGWRMGKETSVSGALPFYLLKPDSFLVITSSAALASLRNFGPAISVGSFPSIDNDGGLIYIQDQEAHVIHAVSYDLTWYRNERKADGGWTLEMIDPLNCCSGTTNWTASQSNIGGTPGQLNSVNAINPDTSPPIPLRSYAIANDTLMIIVDEPVDSVSATRLSNYTINDGLRISYAVAAGPVFDKIKIAVQPALIPEKMYQLDIRGLTDCSNNTMPQTIQLKAGLPRDPLSGECVINEILFNPYPNGVDYVEIYNTASAPFDLSRIWIANRNSSGMIASMKAISIKPYYLFNGEYLLITENPSLVSRNYLVKDLQTMMTVKPMPSMPDDEGTIVLLNFQGEMMDEVHYSQKWHFELLRDKEGIALERIDVKGRSNDPLNWHSASSSVGYGTPGYRNSQYYPVDSLDKAISISPLIFSPDNDGRDDFLRINYKLPSPGFMATIVVYDAAGRAVRMLANNSLLGIKGFWQWDGLNNQRARLPPGNYVVLSELFNLQARRFRYKHSVTLARSYY